MKYRGRALSGKYAAGGKTGGRLDEEQMRQLALKTDDRATAIVLEVTVASELDCSPAQVTLALVATARSARDPHHWGRKAEQLRDNLASLEVNLNADRLVRLNNVSEIEMGFPYDFFDR